MTLAEYTIGDGPNLTLVHGWGLGAGAWRQVAHMLADTFTVHVVDLPGYGATPPTDNNSLNALADALAAALPPRAMVCGWSLGAMVCLACAARYPRQIARMVLAGSTASFVQRDGWPDALPLMQLESFLDELETDPAALLRHFSQLINHGDARARDAARTLRACLEDGLPADPATLRAGLDVLADADLRELVTRVMQPTLLIHGAVDPLMPLAAARRLARDLYDGKMEEFEGSAHAPFASEPERFVDMVNRFAGVSE